MISDEIDIFDIAATDGPAYELDDLTIEQIVELTNRLDSRELDGRLTGNPQLLVHRNHERKADEVFDLIFGPKTDHYHQLNRRGSTMTMIELEPSAIHRGEDDLPWLTAGAVTK